MRIVKKFVAIGHAATFRPATGHVIAVAWLACDIPRSL